MKTRPMAQLFAAMYHEKYDFSDFLNMDVAENFSRVSIKTREVVHANKRLKAYQSFVQTFVLDYLRLNERVAQAYRKGSSLRVAVERHAGSRSFLQTDIASFFPSIGRDLVRSTIASQIHRTPVLDLDLYIDRVLDLVTVDGQLPVGFSTSPSISNSCLCEFDDDLEAYCLERSLVYTRYADDIVVSAQDRSLLIGVQSEIETKLRHHFLGNLQLNLKKTKITSVGRKVKLLGMVILPTGRVTVNMDLKKQIEVMLHYYTTNKIKFLKLDLVDDDMEAGVERLAGYVNYINSIDKPYLEKLRRKFGTTTLDSLLHRSAT